MFRKKPKLKSLEDFTYLDTSTKFSKIVSYIRDAILASYIRSVPSKPTKDIREMIVIPSSHAPADKDISSFNPQDFAFRKKETYLNQTFVIYYYKPKKVKK